MKKFILLIVVFSFFFSCSPTRKDTLGYKLNPDAYQIIEKKQNECVIAEYPYNEQNELEGIVVQYYECGGVYMTYGIKDEKKTGEAIWYYENGEKYTTGNYIDGELEGVVVKYYEDGTKMSETFYKKGELQQGTIEYNQLGKRIRPVRH